MKVSAGQNVQRKPGSPARRASGGYFANPASGSSKKKNPVGEPLPRWVSASSPTIAVPSHRARGFRVIACYRYVWKHRSHGEAGRRGGPADAVRTAQADPHQIRAETSCGYVDDGRGSRPEVNGRTLQPRPHQEDGGAVNREQREAVQIKVAQVRCCADGGAHTGWKRGARIVGTLAGEAQLESHPGLHPNGEEEWGYINDHRIRIRETHTVTFLYDQPAPREPWSSQVRPHACSTQRLPQVEMTRRKIKDDVGDEHVCGRGRGEPCLCCVGLQGCRAAERQQMDRVAAEENGVEKLWLFLCDPVWMLPSNTMRPAVFM